MVSVLVATGSTPLRPFPSRDKSGRASRSCVGPILRYRASERPQVDVQSSALEVSLVALAIGPGGLARPIEAQLGFDEVFVDRLDGDGTCSYR